MAERSSRIDDTQLAQRAVEFGIASPREVRALLERARASDPPTPLLELLVAEHLLPAREAERLARGEPLAPPPPPPPETALPERFEDLLGWLLTETRHDELWLPPGSPPLARCGEHLQPLAPTPVAAETLHDWQLACFGAGGLAPLAGGRTITRWIVHPAGRVRVWLTPAEAGPTLRLVPLRPLPDRLPHRLPPAVARLAHLPRGLVVLASARRALRRQALTEMIEVLAHNRAVHVVVIEPTLRVALPSERALVVQREVGLHAASYAGALASALRQDPDVIVVSELREPDAMATAVQAAETGHLVICSVHGTDPEQTVRHLVDVQSHTRRDLVRVALAASLQAVAALDEVCDLEGQPHWIADVLPRSEALVRLLREDRLHQLETVSPSALGRVAGDEQVLQLLRAQRIGRLEALAHLRATPLAPRP
ncbi:MAG: hypothetical protein D6776_10455 [Planctomycetota bacterium]|nr:MAG: hypothetical protein D6776_10455 [Planctomycetota bacterium]